MEKLFYITLFLLPAFVQKASAQSQPQMEAMMKMLSLKTALQAKDSATLASLLAEDVTYGHTNGLVQTKSELIRSVMSGEQDYKNIEPADLNVRIYGNAAVVTMKAKVNMFYKGSPLDMSMVITLTWIKEKDWKLVARQSTKL